MLIFPPKLYVICLQSYDTWCGWIFTLAEEDHIKPKRGVFYPLAVEGGVSPRKFLKQTDAFLAHFCRLPVEPPPPNPTQKIVHVIFAFKAPFSDIRDAGDFFSFRMWGGGGGSSSFFFCENRMQMMHSESIHSLMGVGIFLKFHFCHKSPDVQATWWGFPLIYRGFYERQRIHV